MSVTYHKLVEIAYKSQSAKFKIRSASRSAEIQEAIRARFDLAPNQRFVLIDKRDDADVVVDGTLETGSYTLELVEDVKALGCCPPGSLPATQPPSEYKVKGKLENWNGVPVYVSGNKESKSGRAIVIFPDIFGVNSGRSQQIADEWALSGYLSVIIDFFGKDIWSADRDFKDLPAWCKKYTWDSIGDAVETVVAHLQALGFKKLGSVGFCWGTYGVLKVSASGQFLAGVHFHPSHVRIAGFLGVDENELVDAVKCPQLLLPAGNDPDNVKEKGSNIQTLSKKPFKSAVREFPEMQHGWVNRGDLTNPTVARDVRQAMDLATSWFNKHL